MTNNKLGSLVWVLIAAALLVSALFFAGRVVAADCRKTGEVCVAPNETRNIQGLSVFRECWEWRNTYECRSTDMVNDCQRLRDRGCSQLGSVCVHYDAAGTCSMYEQSYQCPDQPEIVTERTVCDQTAFCQDDGAACFDTSSPPDSDLGQSVALMEAVRQAGVYGLDPNEVEIFKGYLERCTVKVLGGSTIKSCCESSGGGASFSNNAMLGAGMSVAGEAGGEAARLGSKYVYDALYQQVDSSLMNKGLDAMNSWASGLGDGTFNPSFSMYGFTFEFSMANGFQFTGFDPYSFAISVAIMVVMEWLECDTSEQVVGMKRGLGLCVHVRTYCSSEVLGACVERKQEHCCFNSKLAKIINRQGRTQLGLPMDQCGGFDQDQILALDFSAMDLSEFIADVVPAEPDLAQMTDRVGQSVEERVQDYYSR